MDLADQSPLIGRLDTPFRHPDRNVHQASALEGLSTSAISLALAGQSFSLCSREGRAHYYDNDNPGLRLKASEGA